MLIYSWNVNGIRAVDRKKALDWFYKEQPDVLCIQETKAHPEQLVSRLKEPPNYFSYFSSSEVKKGYSGVAIYSKIKPNKVEHGFGEKKFDQEGRILVAHYDDFVLMNIYYPNGGMGPERLQFKMDFYDYFLKNVDKLKKKGLNVIICGDFNTAHNEIDLARPKPNEKNTGFLPMEREWITKFISHGYVDIFRKMYPEKVKYTYWDLKTRARDRNVGWRIDYFFVSEGFEKKIKSTEIRNEIMGSDHCPLFIELKK